MAVTLKKNGFELSPDFLKGFAQVVGTFQPKLPPMNAELSAPPLGNATASPNPVPSPPAKTPAVTNQATSPATDDDDPIGAGGFITPPTGDSPNK